MSLWRKKSQPLDRAVAELEEQIAAVQRQLRQASQPVTPRAVEPVESKSFTGFVKEMIAPNRRATTPARRPRTDLFDLGNEALKELETDAMPHQPVAGADEYGEPLSVAMPPKTHDDRLIHYLSAGTFRGQKPIKRIQRQQRNRFFMWIGLSFVALWLLYVVIR